MWAPLFIAGGGAYCGSNQWLRGPLTVAGRQLLTDGLLPGGGVYCAANGGAGLPQLVPASWPLRPRQKSARAESSQSEVPAAPAVVLQHSEEQVAQAGERQWPRRDSGGAVNRDQRLRRRAPGAHPTASL